MKFLANKKLIKIWVVVLGILVLALPFLVQAGIGDFVTDAIAWLGLALVNFFGTLLLALIDILIRIASFNTFIDSEAVSIGWVVVRDIANMFFVIVLLIIAFATILKIESYTYQRTLIKLILAVIWVNFSKMITGLFIDIGQVVMMTFVNAFREIAAGNLTYGFGLEDVLKLRQGGAEGRDMAVGSIDNWDVLGGILLGLIFLIVAGAVILIIIVFLLVRIIYLWILAIFSPLVFILPLVPGGQKYASQWWQNLSKYIVLGPVLAFFLWLTFMITAKSGESTRRAVIRLETEQAGGEAVDRTWFASEISGTQKIFNFMVTTALLIMAIGFAQEVGGVAGKFAGQVQGKLGQWGKKAALGAVRFAATRPTRLANWGLRKIPGVKKTFAGKWAEDIYQRREAAKTKRRIAAMRKLGMGDKAFEYIAEKYPLKPRGSFLRRQVADRVFGRTRKAALKEAAYVATQRRIKEAINNVDPGVRRREWRRWGVNKFMGTGNKLEAGAYDALNNASAESLQSLTDVLNSEHAAATASGDAAKIVDINDKIESIFDAIAAMYKKDGSIKNRNLQDWVDNRGNTVVGGNILAGPGAGLDMANITGRVDKVAYMRDISQEKQDRTRAMVVAQGMNFFESDEYQNNKDKYYTREEYVDNEGYRRWTESHEKGGMSIDNFAQGRASEMTVDFNDLQDIEGLEGLKYKGGVNMSDIPAEQRQTIADQISHLIGQRLQELKDQYRGVKDEDIPHGDRMRMRNYELALNKLEKPEELSKLTLYNTSREGIGARRLITHEQKHQMIEEIDSDGSIQRATWDEHWQSRSPEEKERVMQQVRDKMGDQSMQEPEIIKEYFAEALTNETQWGDKSDNAIRLEEGMLEKFEGRLIDKVGGSITKLSELKDSEKLKRKMWRGFSDEKQKQIVERVRQEQDNPEISDIQARDIYLEDAWARATNQSRATMNIEFEEGDLTRLKNEVMAEVGRTGITAPIIKEKPVAERASAGVITDTTISEGRINGAASEALLNELRDIKGLLNQSPEGRATKHEVQNIQNVLSGGRPASSDNYKVLKAISNLSAYLKKNMAITNFGVTGLTKRLAGVSKAVTALGDEPPSGHEPIVMGSALREEADMTMGDLRAIVGGLSLN